MIIYSSDIGSYPVLKNFKNKDKKRFIKTDKPSLTLPVILMGRTKVPNFVLIKQSEYDLIAENHVNCIWAKEGENIDNLYDILISDDVKEYCKTHGGTLNFSKTQTEGIWIRPTTG